MQLWQLGRRLREAIDSIPTRQEQSNLFAASGILAGLVLDKPLIRRLLRRELMHESVIYQDLWETARAEALQEVLQEITEEVREELRQQIRLEEERLNEARSLVFRLLKRKLGEIPIATKAQIETLSIAQLEDLGEALLDFATLADLSAWLERLPQKTPNAI